MVASSGCNFSFRSDSFNLDHLSFACTRKRVCYSEKVSFGSSEDARIKYSPTPSRSLCGFCQRMGSELLSPLWGKFWDSSVSCYFLLCWLNYNWLRFLFPLPFCVFIIAYDFAFVNRFLKNICDFLYIFYRSICNRFAILLRFATIPISNPPSFNQKRIALLQSSFLYYIILRSLHSTLCLMILFRKLLYTLMG